MKYVVPDLQLGIEGLKYYRKILQGLKIFNPCNIFSVPSSVWADVSPKRKAVAFAEDLGRIRELKMK